MRTAQTELMLIVVMFERCEAEKCYTAAIVSISPTDGLMSFAPRSAARAVMVD